MQNYDVNRDGTLDPVEVKKLFNDVESYDYAGQVVAQLGDVQAWISKFDESKDGKITVKELIHALQAHSNFISMTAVPINSTSTNKTHHQEKPDETDKKLQQYAKWVLDNYDFNKDGTLDENEAKKLWNDIATYDYSGEILAQVGQVQQWIARFDTNRDGKLTLGELLNALNQIA
jgi:EF-hand domain pair